MSIAYAAKVVKFLTDRDGVNFKAARALAVISMRLNDLELMKHYWNLLEVYSKQHPKSSVLKDNLDKLGDLINLMSNQASLPLIYENKAMKVEPKTGGIDLTRANMNLQIQNVGEGIKFHLDPTMLQQLQNAPGFVPVIINIQPLKSLSAFLDVNQLQS